MVDHKFELTTTNEFTEDLDLQPTQLISNFIESYSNYPSEEYFVRGKTRLTQRIRTSARGLYQEHLSDLSHDDLIRAKQDIKQLSVFEDKGSQKFVHRILASLTQKNLYESKRTKREEILRRITAEEIASYRSQHERKFSDEFIKNILVTKKMAEKETLKVALSELPEQRRPLFSKIRDIFPLPKNRLAYPLSLVGALGVLLVSPFLQSQTSETLNQENEMKPKGSRVEVITAPPINNPPVSNLIIEGPSPVIEPQLHESNPKIVTEQESPSLESLSIEVPEEYRVVISLAAKNNGVPVEILSSLLYHESEFDPDAVSSVGAVGIAQFMPETARSLKIDPKEPISSIKAAASYLKSLYNQFGSWELALAAYNAGEGNVRKYGNIPPFEETKAFVKGVLAKAGSKS